VPPTHFQHIPHPHPHSALPGHPCAATFPHPTTITTACTATRGWGHGSGPGSLGSAGGLRSPAGTETGVAGRLQPGAGGT
jgi:hypothetical protein